MREGEGEGRAAGEGRAVGRRGTRRGHAGEGEGRRAGERCAEAAVWEGEGAREREWEGTREGVGGCERGSGRAHGSGRGKVRRRERGRVVILPEMAATLCQR